MSQVAQQIIVSIRGLKDIKVIKGGLIFHKIQYEQVFSIKKVCFNFPPPTTFVELIQVPNYYKVIHRPMDLTSIRAKLQPTHFEQYESVEEFIADCKQIFKNCATFNDVRHIYYSICNLSATFNALLI